MLIFTGIGRIVGHKLNSCLAEHSMGFYSEYLQPDCKEHSYIPEWFHRGYGLEFSWEYAIPGNQHGIRNC